MLFKCTGLFVTAVAALFIAASANAQTIVYQDSFDDDGYGTNAGIGGGLQNTGGLYADWVETEAGITFSGGGNGGTHRNLATINSFDLTGGFELTVSYTVSFPNYDSTRFVMGVMDAALIPPVQEGPGGTDINRITTGLGPKAEGLIDTGRIAYSYGIGFAPYTANQLNGLTFADGTTLTEIDQTQSRTTGAHTLVLGMDDASNWSYSIDGATPTTGTIAETGFDYTRNYCFVVKAQKMAVTVSAVTLTSNADNVLAGDADGDGDVDAADYIMVKRHFGGAPGAEGPGGDIADGPNGPGQDGVVDWYDLQLLQANYSPDEATSAVPEPATMMMFLAAGLPALLKRRRACPRP